jgi:hypothetical protein
VNRCVVLVVVVVVAVVVVVVEVVVVTVVLVIEVVTAIVSGLSLAILSKIRALIITTTNKFAVLIRHHSFSHLFKILIRL